MATPSAYSLTCKCFRAEILQSRRFGMDAFNQQLMRRSPLAAAVLETCDFLFDDAWLVDVYEAHRGRCYEDKLTFGQFLQLTRDALLRHEGSAHQLFVELEADKSHPI